MDDKFPKEYNCWLIKDRFMAIAYDDRVIVIPVDENLNAYEVTMVIIGGQEGYVSYLVTSEVFMWGEIQAQRIDSSRSVDIFDNIPKHINGTVNLFRDEGEVVNMPSTFAPTDYTSTVGRVFATAKQQILERRMKKAETE